MYCYYIVTIYIYIYIYIYVARVLPTTTTTTITHYNSNGIPPSKAILLQKDTLLSKDTLSSQDILLKEDTRITKRISQLEFLSINRCSTTLLSGLPTTTLSNRYHCSCHTATVCELNNSFQ